MKLDITNSKSFPHTPATYTITNTTTKDSKDNKENKESKEDNLDELNKEIDNPLSKFHIYFLQKNKVNIIKYVEWFRNLRKSKNKETYFVNKLKI